VTPASSKPGSFLGPPVPRVQEHEFIPPWTVSPSESLVTSRPSDSPAGLDSPEVFSSLQRHPRASPLWSGPSRSHSGSALRLSQPLSGFLASSSSTALFRAATVPGCPPSELSPRRDRVPLSRPLAPPQLSTTVPGRAPARPFASCFPDFHAYAQLPGSPVDYGLPFRDPQLARFPFTLGPARYHPFPVASPTSELCSPCESVRSAPGEPGNEGRCSPGLSPS
jgi:hypothetical protein